MKRKRQHQRRHIQPDIEEERRHIPPEIVEGILIKLPVKSLNRFRSVSKSWQSLISSRRFITKHFINAESELLQKTLIHPEHLNTLPFYVPRDLDHRYLLRPQSSCNGLICIQYFARRTYLYVWNPYVRIYKHISCSMGVCFGLGYDAARDDYKIMTLSSRRRKTEIYSLKTNSWTRADDYPGGTYRTPLRACERLYMDGAIHWLDTHNKSIFSFDLSTNRYKLRIPLPEYKLLCDGCFHQIRLAAIRRMLYVLINDRSGLILWGLKEDYRDQNSWIRLLQIPWRVLTEPPEYFKLFYVYENGEFLIGTTKGSTTEMIICKDSQIILRQRTPHHRSVIWDGIFQVESLV